MRLFKIALLSALLLCSISGICKNPEKTKKEKRIERKEQNKKRRREEKFDHLAKVEREKIDKKRYKHDYWTTPHFN